MERFGDVLLGLSVEAREGVGSGVEREDGVTGSEIDFDGRGW